LNLPSAAGRRLRIVLVGDSTVADGAGWGRAFRRFLSADVDCNNAALNGRSSKSYRGEGHWEPALALKGDYYLIQFGHNDQPGKGPDRETDPSTSYQANMARYVDEVRAIGATAILVTSLTRREFAKDGSGRIVSTLGPYVDAVRKVAAEKHVPLIDLYAASLALCEQLGPEKCAALGAKKENGAVDTTHLSANGSLVFARLVVDRLRSVAPKLSPNLLAEPNTSTIFH
jgi:pectinesterase